MTINNLESNHESKRQKTSRLRSLSDNIRQNTICSHVTEIIASLKSVRQQFSSEVNENGKKYNMFML